MDLIQAVNVLLQEGILLEQELDLLFDRCNLGLEVGDELGVLLANEALLMMLGLVFGHGLARD